MKHTPILIAPIVFVLLFGSCSKPKPNSPEAAARTPVAQDLVTSETDHESCLQAAQKFLGPGAELLKCGHLNDAAHLEAVAGIRVPGMKDDRNGIPISKLMILQQGKPQWDIELDVDEEITNSVGYVGTNFIDDSHSFPYYRVTLHDRGTKWGAGDLSPFSLGLLPMTRDGKIDVGDMGLAIGWNPAVGRFQDIELNGDEFDPEVKTPKHIRYSK